MHFCILAKDDRKNVQQFTLTSTVNCFPEIKKNNSQIFYFINPVQLDQLLPTSS